MKLYLGEVGCECVDFIQQVQDSVPGDFSENDNGKDVRFLAGSVMENFSLRHRVQTGSGAHPASYSKTIEDSNTGDKAVGA
jgi:hypothetical protein